MREREDVVAAVVAATDGELIGRVRLQKAVYLLEQLGLNSGFEFDYHHYGPYSRDLDNATADAKAFNLISENYGYRNSDGARFSIFKLEGRARDDAYGGLGVPRTTALMRAFANTNITVLELAATVDWLSRYEKVPDWRAEITKRKGRKVQDGRLEKAIVLLNEIGLPPQPSKAAL